MPPELKRKIVERLAPYIDRFFYREAVTRELAKGAPAKPVASLKSPDLLPIHFPATGEGACGAAATLILLAARVCGMAVMGLHRLVSTAIGAVILALAICGAKAETTGPGGSTALWKAMQGRFCARTGVALGVPRVRRQNMREIGLIVDELMRRSGARCPRRRS